MSHVVPLRDNRSGEFTPAKLIDRVDVDYASRTDDVWTTFQSAEIARASAAGKVIVPSDHDHWSWKEKALYCQRLLAYQILAIECEGEAQGMMMVLTDGEFSRITADRGKPLVYVSFLASAPWNLSTIVENPRFRGTGTMFMRRAVEISMDLGFNGRVGLHSLPGSESFYARYDMTNFGQDPKKQDLTYFEMTPAQAAALIK